MSTPRNENGNFMPHGLQRTITGTLSSLNAELVLDVNGDESAAFYIDGGGATLNATYIIEGSFDGVNFGLLLAFPNPTHCLGGTIPPAAQPMVLEALNAASIKRSISVCVSQLKKIKIRLSAYAAGSAVVVINSDTCASINPYVRDQKAATLILTATGAAGAAVTATLPAVAGLRHYIDRISVLRSMTTAQTASATPTVVTTTNISGAPALTFGTDAAAIGQDKEQVLDFGGAGMSATAVNTATTVVAPILAGAIWRINVAYRLGL